MKKIVTLIVAFMLIAGSAWAWDYQEHVKMAPNGKGDLIIYPFYFAGTGWQTKLTVYNTSDRIVVAKVAFRTYNYSQEILDFLIYLSPHDYWTAYVRNDGTGPYIYSEDDSMFSAQGVWANETPAHQPLFGAYCSTDSNIMGYVEVMEQLSISILNKTGANGPYEAAYAAAQNDLDTTDVLNTNPATGPIDKWLVFRSYQDALGLGGIASNSTEDLEAAYARTGWTDNSLGAAMHMEYPAANWSGGMRPTIMRDYKVDTLLAVGGNTRLGDYVSRNSLGEVEAVLAKQNLALPYTNREGTATIHVLTFPTKLTRYADNMENNYGKTEEYDNCEYVNGFFAYDPGFAHPDTGTNIPFNPATPNAAGAIASHDAEYSPFFYYSDFNLENSERCVDYGIWPYNMYEQTYINPGNIWSGEGAGPTSGLCYEMNLLPTNHIGSIFDEGWIDYVLLSRSNDPKQFMTDNPNDSMAGAARFDRYTYTGAPVLGTVIYLNNGGLSLFEGAWNDGAVSVNFDAPNSIVNEISNDSDYRYFDIYPDVVPGTQILPY